MKKWFIRIVIVLFLIVIGGISLIFIFDEIDKQVISKHVKNDKLPTIKTDWPGTPKDEKDRFVNQESPFLPKTRDLLKWKLGGNPQAEEKRNDTARLQVLDPTAFLNGDRDGILWLGHASVFLRLNGKNILLDPIFGNLPFVKRFVDVPSPLDKLKKVDYILISHDHRDHCDEETLRQLAQKFPNAKFLAGLGMEDILNEWKTPSNEVETAGWFQKFDNKTDDVRIYFLPVRHWSRRGLFDTNQRLWGGFVIESEKTTVYFGGDSGYGIQYAQLAQSFPKIDYFIVGIGAYSPRWIMEPNHNSPDDAVKAFLDSKSGTLVPVHYGTFDLSDEPPNEPLKLLRESAAKNNVAGKIRVLQINESLNF